MQGHTSYGSICSHLHLLQCFGKGACGCNSFLLSTDPVSESAHVPDQWSVVISVCSQFTRWYNHSKTDFWCKQRRILLVNQWGASLVPGFHVNHRLIYGAGVPPWVAVAAGVRALQVERLHPGRPLWGLPLGFAGEEVFQSILYLQLKQSYFFDLL